MAWSLPLVTSSFFVLVRKCTPLRRWLLAANRICELRKRYVMRRSKNKYSGGCASKPLDFNDAHILARAYPNARRA